LQVWYLHLDAFGVNPKPEVTGGLDESEAGQL